MTTRSTYLRLEVISGNGTGDTLVVEDELVIGRHAEGPGRLSEDEEISRRHARLSREATGDYAIEDLGSSNGTFVNGLRIQSPVLLSLGDSIEVGATTLVVRGIVQPEPEPVAPHGGGHAAARAAPTVFARVPVAQDAAEPVGQASPPPLRLEIDFDAREARLALGDSGETVRLVFVDGVWRVGT
jgi:predicted component of type VI protein secretion system